MEYLRRMTDIICPPSTHIIIRTLDVIATHVTGFRADGMVRQRSPVRSCAESKLLLAAVGHAVGELHVVVDGVVDGLDAVGVVDGEFGIVVGLDGLVDHAVDDSERVEVERDSFGLSGFDLFVLFVEIVEELAVTVLASSCPCPCSATHSRSIVSTLVSMQFNDLK